MKRNISATAKTTSRFQPLETRALGMAAAMLLIASATAGLPRATTTLRGIAYASPGGTAQKLDLYLPAKPGNEKRPAIVWIHGGGWKSGSNGHGGRVLPMVGKGFVVADINYRLSGQAPFPAQLIDCKSAIRWLRAHAGEYHIDPDRIGVAGDSAGAHLAALVGTSEGVAGFEVGEHLEQSSAVQAVCALSPPTDMEAIREFATEKDRATIVQLLGGDPKNEPYASLFKKTNPIAYIGGAEPPFLIMHGTHDREVPYTQSVLLNEALTKANVDSTIFFVKEGDHALNGGTNASRKKIDKMISDFFRQKL